MRFRLEEAETICSCLMDDAKASRFNLKDKGEIKAELRRALEAEAERRGIIESEASTGEEIVEEALEG